MKRRDLTFYSLCLTLSLLAHAEAQHLGEEFDDSGREIFKSSPVAPIPEALPSIKKENFDARLAEIKAKIPLTCAKHGGIDCSKEDIKDHSVVCADGFLDSKEIFLELCSQTRLQLLSETFLSDKGVEIPAELRKPKNFGGIVPHQIVVKLRNLSGIPAKRVLVEGEIVKRRFSAVGPQDIQPFELEEYTVRIDERHLPPFSDFRTKYKTKVTCDNCLSTRKNLQ